MNSKQRQILKEIKNCSIKLGHSPRKREIHNLAQKCYKYFGSFNRVKKLANLEIVNVRKTNFPKNAFKIDRNLAFISAFLTADGHVYKDLKGFYFSSNNLNILKKIEGIIKNKFGIKGLYREGNGYGISYKFLVFNKPITLFLVRLGIPPGDKMTTPFDVPECIKNNKKLSKEYLKILFYCEGGKSKQSKNTEKIKINFNKSERLLEDGLKFMNSLKKLLKEFNIETTNIWVSEGNKRKRDGEITKQINFHIKSNSVNRFINEIGWLK